MMQNWLRITFLHWRYAPQALAARLPAGLEIDTFEGSAWVGLTPFELTGLRPPFLPPLPHLSRFPETNLRTYVRERDGSRGIWFFSLDAARAAAVAGARIGYGLPYAWSRMQISAGSGRTEYLSRRLWPDRIAGSEIAIEPGGDTENSGLAAFLVERYRLYSTIAGRLTYTPVEHPPWLLKNAALVRLEQSITQAAGLGVPEGRPLIYFSEGVRARIGMWRPARIN